MELQDPSMMITSPEKAIEVDEEEEEGAPLPGFRFHPTDEEVVSFYLKRKIEEKPLSIEIIKQIDIYKYDPWDLAKVGSVGDKEWYFYCKRGRKYKNSVRPNRVTGSGGFWKATGIDRPIYDSNNVAANKFAAETRKIVGLKKSLVYYRGTAGKGSKTDWMMHEFRLPSTSVHLHQAEIWTLCRIFKRSRKHTPDWREFPSKGVSITTNNNNITSAKSNNNERYISFTNPSTTTQQQQQQQQQYDNHCIKHSTKRSLDELQRMDVKSKSVIHSTTSNPNPNSYHNFKGQWASPLMDYQANPSQLASNFLSPLNSSSSLYDQDQGDDVNYWEDLSSVVEFAIREIYNQN